MLFGWACFAASGHPEILREDRLFLIACVDYIELGSDFLMKNLICIVFAICNATDIIWTHPQTVVCVILAFRQVRNEISHFLESYLALSSWHRD